MSVLNNKLADALRGIVELGKRDLTSPKYDGYFDAAREAIAEHDAQTAPAPVQAECTCSEIQAAHGHHFGCPTLIAPAADGAGELPPLPKDPNVCMTGTGAEFAVYTMTDMRNYARAALASHQESRND